MENALGDTHNRIKKKQNNSEIKYGKIKNNKIAEWINNMIKELKELEEGPSLVDLHLNSLRAMRKYQIWKHEAIMTYIDSSLKIYAHPRQISSAIA